MKSLIKCPHCAFEQEDGLLSCLSCQIVFSKWKPRMSARVDEAPLSAKIEKRRTKTKPAINLGPVLGLAGLALAALIGWQVLNPAGLPVPAEAFRDSQQRFAISKPEGWLTLDKANYTSMMAKLKDKLPPQFQSGMSEHMSVGFVALDAPAEFKPSINVQALEGTLPPLDEKQRDEAAAAIATQMRSVMEDYKQESVRIVDVDRLKSLEIVSSAGFKLRTGQPAYLRSGGVYKANPAAYTTYRLRYRQLMVRGRQHYFILTATSDLEHDELNRRHFEQAFASFRVLQRPAAFGPVMSGALQGGLTGGLIALVFALFRRRLARLV